MLRKVFFNAAVVFIQLHLTFISAYNYGILMRDEEIFSPCNFENVTHFGDYVDMSNMKFERLMNGSIYFHGHLIVLRDFVTKNNAVTAQIYKKSRGNWIDTVYNLRREDFCLSLFEPLQLWSPYMKDISQEDRTCPLTHGRKLYFDNVADMTLNIPDPNFGGEGKLQLIVRFTELNEVFCADVFAEAYRQ